VTDLAEGMPSLEDLIKTLIAREPTAAERPAAIRVVRAPGRVNLIGEHTDYNDGLVMPAAIDREIRIAYIRTDDRDVWLTRIDTGERDHLTLDDDRPPQGTWMDYVAGTAAALGEAGLSVLGLRGIIATSLPESAGLSSSAAIEVAAAWSLLDDASAVDGLALARICQRGENGYVGVQSGLMDQFAVACGSAEAATMFDCRSFEARTVPLPPGVSLVVCDTGSPRRLGRSEYNVRRSQCEAAVMELARDDPAVRSLRDVGPDLLAHARHRLDPVVARRVDHVIGENRRVVDVFVALENGDLRAVGEAFAASHASLRDLYEVSSPELDALVDISVGVTGVIGSRMTGAGFGGCTISVVESSAIERLREAVMREYPERTGLAPRVIPVRLAPGASRIR
jgi:galactokinase